MVTFVLPSQTSSLPPFARLNLTRVLLIRSTEFTFSARTMVPVSAFAREGMVIVIVSMVCKISIPRTGAASSATGYLASAV